MIRKFWRLGGCVAILGVLLAQKTLLAAEEAKGQVTVAIYFKSLETAEKDTIPVVIEIRNDSDTSVNIYQYLTLDMKFEVKEAGGTKLIPAAVVQPQGPRGDTMKVVLRLVMPLVANRDVIGLEEPLSILNEEETTLEPGKNILAKIDLPAKILPPGMSTIQVVLAQKGKDVSVSAPVKMTCR